MPRCSHADDVRVVVAESEGCEDCLRMGGRWVHLRLCLECGHVACCDSSPNRHASAHARDTSHPLVASIEPGEAWRYCYVDGIML